MQNENREIQSGGIKRNPSRNNTNVNQGQNYEKSFNPETDVAGGGVPDATGTPDVKQSSGEKSTENKQASSGSNQHREGLSGTTSKGSSVREGVSGSSDQAGAGASYGQQNEQTGTDTSQLGTGGQGQRLMGEDMKNRNSGTAPGESNMGNLQNAKRGGQKEGQFGQDQDDSRRV
ncbi:MAG: hypothetical protein ACLGHN_08445 [Bacteriovoracia bacterium]